MDCRRALRIITLGGLAVLSTAACSSSPARLRSSTMCQAAGGTYANGTCQPATTSRTAAEMCRAHGGTYFAGGDYCEVEGAWKP
jgi:hypothetical protein